MITSHALPPPSVLQCKQHGTAQRMTRIDIKEAKLKSFNWGRTLGDGGDPERNASSPAPPFGVILAMGRNAGPLLAQSWRHAVRLLPFSNSLQSLCLRLVLVRLSQVVLVAAFDSRTKAGDSGSVLQLSNMAQRVTLSNFVLCLESDNADPAQEHSHEGSAMLGGPHLQPRSTASQAHSGRAQPDSANHGPRACSEPLAPTVPGILVTDCQDISMCNVSVVGGFLRGIGVRRSACSIVKCAIKGAVEDGVYVEGLHSKVCPGGCTYRGTVLVERRFGSQGATHVGARGLHTPVARGRTGRWVVAQPHVKNLSLERGIRCSPLPSLGADRSQAYCEPQWAAVLCRRFAPPSE